MREIVLESAVITTNLQQNVKKVSVCRHLHPTIRLKPGGSKEEQIDDLKRSLSLASAVGWHILIAWLLHSGLGERPFLLLLSCCLFDTGSPYTPAGLELTM